ncbi:MAG TPA: S53 family peptidase [Jatrophihabitans sp.]|nr:S53 family peptidase [Jatrophihabitans sp.]
MHKRRITAALIAATTVTGTAIAATGSAQAQPATRTIPHTQPAWTAHAQHLGAARSNAVVRSRVYLAPKGGVAALKSFVTAVSTPGSAQYQHFLTHRQYLARFGTTNRTVRRVESYLRAAGLHVTGVGTDNHYVAARGTVAASEQAFGTTLAVYRHDGRVVRAPAHAVTLPASLGASVLTVTGLNTAPHRAAPASNHTNAAPAGFRNARPCSIYYGQIQAKYQADYKTPLPKFKHQTLPYAPCGYTGPQYRAAYEGNSKLDGSGITVAITDAYAAPTIAKDANTYAKQHGDGAYAPGQLTQTVIGHPRKGKICGPTGWYGEETLDVEAVHAMAPGADIHYYGARSCFDNDLLDALARVVSDDTAQLVTNSWGDVEEAETADAIAAYEQVFMQGEAEGMSFMFSSGDNGDELQNTGIKQADYPTSDPYVTSVGGTSTAIGPDGSIEFQTGWGTEKYSLSSDGKSWQPVGFIYGAGGGTSALFNRPTYQDGFTSSAARQVPDVAMDADPTTGMLVGETQQFPDGTYYDEYRIGGTSLASPLFAGMTALREQSGGGAGLGLLNEQIYGNSSAFDDVAGPGPDKGNVRVDYANGVDGSDGLVYSVRTFDQDSSLKVTPGYDLVTGIGVPNQKWTQAPAS